MKKLLIAIALIAGLGWHVPANAYSKAPTTPGATEQKIISAKTALEFWAKSISGGNAQKIVDLYDNDAVLLATLAAKPITDQAGRIAYFEKLTAKPEMKVTLQEMFEKEISPAAAVISGTYTFSFRDGDKTVAIPARYTFLFMKHNGKWMINQHHSSRLPEEK